MIGCSIEIEGSTNQPKVAECLWCVAQLFAAVGNLLQETSISDRRNHTYSQGY